jgi:sugar lactone lactonase YvrE
MRFVTFVLATSLAVGTTASAHPPLAEPPELFASGVAGPEGLAFSKQGLVVGTTTGDVLLFDRDGASTVLANVGEPLAGITVLKDGRILAAAFAAGRVWSIDAGGSASVFASGIPGANYIVETRRKKRIFATASSDGTIVDITSGTPTVVASGFNFPNGLVIGKRKGTRYLYVAETFANQVSRIPLDRDDNVVGPAEVYATGLLLIDGIAFDRKRNLLGVGLDTLYVVEDGTSVAQTLSTDPLLNWPASIAFGRGRGFKRRDLYLVNFGPGLGDGMTVIRLRYNHAGAPLSR